MPYLRFQSNVTLDESTIHSLLNRLSKTLADELGKPEQYVMVALEPTSPMIFAGSDDPLAYLELKSIGLPENRTADLSSAISAMVENLTGISRSRIYIEFSDAPRKMWGWNGGTF